MLFKLRVSSQRIGPCHVSSADLFDVWDETARRRQWEMRWTINKEKRCGFVEDQRYRRDLQIEDDERKAEDRGAEEERRAQSEAQGFTARGPRRRAQSQLPNLQGWTSCFPIFFFFFLYLEMNETLVLYPWSKRYCWSRTKFSFLLSWWVWSWLLNRMKNLVFGVNSDAICEPDELVACLIGTMVLLWLV